MHILTPFLLVLAPLGAPAPDERGEPSGTTFGPAIGAYLGAVPGRPRTGAAAGAVLGNGPDKRAAGADPDAAYAAELLDILSTTKSPQVFGLTLMLLGESKADPRRVVPVAIRNAERLGIFGKKTGLYPDGPDELASVVADLIQKLAATAHRPTAVPKPLDLVKPAIADEARLIRTVYVPAFRNEANGGTRLTLESDITAATIRAIAAKTPFKVVSDPKDADIELLGTITSVEHTVLKRGKADTVACGELVVTVDVVWRDRRTGAVLSSAGRDGNAPTPAHIRAVAEYRPEAGETVQSAKEHVCARVAAEVVSVLEKPWGNLGAPQKQPTADRPKALPGVIVPVQPWQTERMDEKYKTADTNPGRVPVLPPVRDGFPNPIDCCDEPTDKEVLTALSPVTRGAPFLYAESRSDFRITKELECERLDAPRFYPLVGPARGHHGTWKCTVTFKETVTSEYPFPVKVSRQRTEVVRVQTTHLHLSK